MLRLLTSMVMRLQWSLISIVVWLLWLLDGCLAVAMVTEQYGCLPVATVIHQYGGVVAMVTAQYGYLAVAVMVTDRYGSCCYRY